MRLSPEVFRQKSLYAHTFLADADAPLHDVWAIHLKGGGPGRTLHSLQPLLRLQNIERVHPIVRGLFAVRFALGKLFGWDDDSAEGAPAPASYFHRLPAADRARSLAQPGSVNGGFRVIYEFENEALSEIINGTVHAFSLLTMEPTRDGYQVCWAIYVKKINWLTPFYMALIDPFRRMLVYPILIRRLEKTWAEGMPNNEA